MNWELCSLAYSHQSIQLSANHSGRRRRPLELHEWPPSSGASSSREWLPVKYNVGGPQGLCEYTGEGLGARLYRDFMSMGACEKQDFMSMRIRSVFHLYRVSL